MTNLMYAALLLHSAGKEVNEENIKKIVESADLKVEEAQIKALVTALEGVNIDEVLKEAVAMPVAAPAGAEADKGEAAEEKKEEKKEEEEKKKEEEAAKGLSALFG